RMVHGVSPLLIEILAGINQQDTPLLLSLRTPEITITLIVEAGILFFIDGVALFGHMLAVTADVKMTH
ncbi:hypothetical protein, partial [Aeromonas caviae]|uniref:hypothetical protein n=2 Tax=Aeromonas caviae TaxID=648 RepID=UPI001CC6728B